MMKRLLLPVLVLGLGFGLLTTLPSPAAESAVSAEKITKLIAQMGSNEFDDREQAQKQLDTIGEPALEALKKAMTSDDTEIRRRAEELVAKIEQRTESAKILQPTKIHLVYKDTPLTEALADFSKKTGYTITLHDPENKLKDRKVTLDTGDTVFWIAFDKFCAAANLVEGKQEDLLPKAQPGQNGQPGQPGAPGAVPNPNPRSVRPIRNAPAQPVAPPAEKPQQKPAEQQQQGRAEAQPALVQVQVQVQVQAQGQAQPAVQPLPAIQPAPNARPILGRPIGQGGVQVQQGHIVLVDGKAKDAPTDYSSAIRIRAMDKNDMFAAAEGQVVLGLLVSPEPKLTWQNLISVTITKAVDDKDQTLAQAAVETPAAPANNAGVARAIAIIRPNGNGVLYTGLHQEIPVYLKKGDKKTKTLKELTGVLHAQVLAPAKAVITTDDVFKSANKTFPGGEKGSIKIIEATKADNGQVRVKFEMQTPQDVVPMNAGNGANNMPGNAPGGPGVILPPGAKGGFQAAPAIQIQGGRLRPNQQAGLGLQAIDDKGNAIPVTVQQQYVQDGNNVRLEYTAIFQLPKEQTVAKLVYSGSRSVTVEVPFTLKDVTLP